MIVHDEGHCYYLNHLDGEGTTLIQFVNRGHGRDCEGVTNQEVLRVLIDRVKFLNSEVLWEGNEKILFHLRSALVLHEERHLERSVEKGKLLPENVLIDQANGHFKLDWRDKYEDNGLQHRRRADGSK
ncbi:MAG: hypothetical protein KJP23_17725 [Deltaproteobacteria bacterium]|nr:hypothetical protein [Deltaproteobacteria bacterium]